MIPQPAPPQPMALPVPPQPPMLAPQPPIMMMPAPPMPPMRPPLMSKNFYSLQIIYFIKFFCSACSSANAKFCNSNATAADGGASYGYASETP